jgi:hypothetical protein
MPDGTYMVEKSDGPAPQDGQVAASLDEAMELTRQMAEGGAPETGEEDMAAAQAGYAKNAMKGAQAPNPGGLFGEG